LGDLLIGNGVGLDIDLPQDVGRVRRRVRADLLRRVVLAIFERRQNRLDVRKGTQQ
jgi:hypothetical protein